MYMFLVSCFTGRRKTTSRGTYPISTATGSATEKKTGRYLSKRGIGQEKCDATVERTQEGFNEAGGMSGFLFSFCSLI